ncbi:MAG: thrombospondin type 3 repeat-containing protein [Pseudomonadales bacterium]|nr:thrombospondin type 3 repeat-containing protein [Pseudomonadales bacterium]
MMSSELRSVLVVLCFSMGLLGCGAASQEPVSNEPQTDIDGNVYSENQDLENQDPENQDPEIQEPSIPTNDQPDNENTSDEEAEDPQIIDEEGNSNAVKVLFIGNSYTTANNLPSLFYQLAESTGQATDVSMAATGGFKFSDHAINANTLEKINSEQWDFVILQNQSQVPGWKPGAVATHSLPHAEVLANAIKANNAESEIIYYVTWGRELGDQDNCDYYPLVCTFEGHTTALLQGYNIYQASTGGTLGLVGSAWEAVVNDSSALFDAGDLWSADGSHPTVTGSYLAANVLYIAVFNLSANGADYTAGLSAENATYLQQIATDTMIVNNPDIDGDGIPVLGYSDNFEEGNLSQLDWVLTGDADWTVTNEISQQGTYSIASGDIAGDLSTSFSVDVDVSDSSVSFWYLVDSEEDYDFLQFYIDGNLVLEASAVYQWTRFKAALAAGSHNLTWTYMKDSSDDEGADKAWVDDILIWKDNCPLVANPDQADIDDDDLGDLCDDDSDNDGVPDLEDAFPYNDAETTDTDNDGIGNNSDGDDDGDGLPDVYEALYAFLDPLSAADASLDQDNDGYSNLREYHAVTSPDDAAVPALALDGINGFYKAIADDGKISDYFGDSVSIDGDTALVGASGVDDGGAAYIYVRDWLGSWVMQAKLRVPDGESGNSFGYSVSLHNGTAVIGDNRNADISRHSGAAYVFVHDGSGNWSFQKKLSPSSDSEIDTLFGASVAIKGDTIIVGAYGDKQGTDFNKIGSAYVFIREQGNWSEQAKLIAADAGPLRSFGNRVAIQDDRVIINSTGGVYLFTRDDNAVWTEQVKLSPLDSVSSIAFNDSHIVMGSSWSDQDSYRAGAVHIYIEHNVDGWTLTDTVFASDIKTLDKFGSHIALSNNVLVVSNSPSAGAKSVYVFEKGADGSWQEQNRIDASDALNNESYAGSLSLDNDTVIVGAHLDDDNGDNAGAVYFYTGLLSDVDLDGIKDAIDNCPAQFNPGQEDADGDSYGDVCDL